MTQPSQPSQEQTPGQFQPNTEYVVAALQEELNAANANRLYLLAVIKQLQAEYQEAAEMWKLEKESLLAGHSEADQTPPAE